MCGIAGLADARGLDRDDAAPALERAIKRLRPRGPDAEALWFDKRNRCAFAHTRLAVIDLSPGAAQPMARHGRVVAYNGEIYNHAELADELRGLGYRFASRSDTEVLLAGWDAWGADVLERLNGMFAFALWDPARGALTLARDRVGKKPLLYHQAGGRLAFASDLDALRAVAPGLGDIDPAALRLLFALRYVPDPHAILSGVRKLAPGWLATWRDGALETRRWRRPAAVRPPRYASETAAAADLRRHLDDAVGARLVADVPVAAFLSGGVDSAIIAASLAARGAGVDAYTVGFEGAPDYYEERPAARATARHLGIKHHELSVSFADVGALADAVFEAADEPFGDSSAAPMLLVSRAMRRHAVVALSGDGADEVFGGYRKHQGELQAARYAALPAALRRGVLQPLAALLPESKANPLGERARRVKKFAAHAGKPAAARQAAWMAELQPDELDRLLPACPPVDLTAMVAGWRHDAADDDAINAMLHADIAIVLAGDMLVKVDRMSMAGGLEVRCPFLDHRVMACAAAMPGAFKLGRGAPKRILRRAFADRLPDTVFTRPKKGFEAPVAQWLVGPLAERVHAAIDPARLKREGLIAPEAPARWYDELKTRRRDRSWALWTLIAFQAWRQRTGV